jgi:hypothetical protein
VKQLAKLVRLFLHDSRGQFEFEHVFLGLGLSTVILVTIAASANVTVSNSDQIAASAKFNQIAVYVSSAITDAFLVTRRSDITLSNATLITVTTLDFPSDFRGHIYIVNVTYVGSDRKLDIYVYAVDHTDWYGVAPIHGIEANSTVEKVIVNGTLTSAMTKPSVKFYRYMVGNTVYIWLNLLNDVKPR